MDAMRDTTTIKEDVEVYCYCEHRGYNAYFYYLTKKY